MQTLGAVFVGYLKISWTKMIWIFIFSILFCIVLGLLQRTGSVKQFKNKKKEIILLGLLGINCAIVFVMTLFGRNLSNEREFSFIPGQSYQNAFATGNEEIILQIVMNIVMFFPFGILLPICFRRMEKWRNVLLTIFFVSLTIEIIQGVAMIGQFELDDIINNVLGGFLGQLVYKIFIFLRRKITLRERSPFN